VADEGLFSDFMMGFLLSLSIWLLCLDWGLNDWEIKVSIVWGCYWVLQFGGWLWCNRVMAT
jgi:hypothetical protein